MSTVRRTFVVHPHPPVVMEYLQDLTHAEQWDPSTHSCTRIDTGPIALGSSWHRVSTFAGVRAELIHTLEKLTSNTVVWVGHNKYATATTTIHVAANPDGPGTVIIYTVSIETSGAARLTAPALKMAMEKIGTDVEYHLVTTLNHLND